MSEPVRFLVGFRSSPCCLATVERICEAGRHDMYECMKCGYATVPINDEGPLARASGNTSLA